MKIKKYYLILVVFAGTLCAPALGQTESLSPEDKPFLIGRPYPTLVGINEVNIFILPSGNEPNINELNWTELETKLTNKLTKASIKLSPGIAGNNLNISEFRVYINMLKLEELQQYVFHIQTSLSRAVYLMEQQSLAFKTDVWKAVPVMQTASIKQMPSEITNTVLEQVEAFIQAHKEANKQVGQSSNIGTNTTYSPTTSEKQTIPAIKSSVAGYRYVASKNSKIFHKPNCRSTKRIKPENLVGYNNREAAIKSGKRPCKTCNP